MSRIRRVLARSATVSALILGGMTISPVAHAGGYGCAGNLIDQHRAVAYPGQVLYGYFYLYYDPATGRNCGVMVSNTDGGSGVSKPMVAGIYVCNTPPGTLCNSASTWDEDAGNYKTFAGPVSVNAAGKCISVGGSIEYAGRKAIVDTDSYHCG